MLQFVENGLHCIYMLRNKTYSSVMASFGVWYMVTLLFLFANFFVRKYILGTGGKKKTQ